MLRLLREILMFNRSIVVGQNAVVLEQRKAVTTVQTTGGNRTNSTKNKTLGAVVDNTKQFSSIYGHVANGGPNKELYKGPNEEILL